MDSGPTVREGGRKRYLKRTVQSKVCGMFLLESQKCKTHIITAVFHYFWGSESATNEKTSQSVTFFRFKG